MNLEIQKEGKFSFYGEWPVEMLSDVASHLKPLEWLLPPWCQICVVSYNARETNATARCRLEFDYRRFTITFGPQWLSCDLNEKQESAVHEMIHAHNLLIAEFARIEIERLIPEEDAPKYRGAVLDGLKMRVEQATCDLTFCLLSKLYGPSQ